MASAPTKFQIALARLVIVLLVVCVVGGSLWYGFSSDELQRLGRDLIDRPTGPMAFRMLLQPLMATIAAISDGLQDARRGRSPYLWTIVSDAAQRRGLLFEGIIATARVILAGLVVDVIYQFVFLKTFYPGEAAIVAVLLCFVPYLCLRGPTARLFRWRNRTNPANSKTGTHAAGQARH